MHEYNFFVRNNFNIYGSLVYYLIGETFVLKWATFFDSAITFDGVILLNAIFIAVIAIGFVEYNFIVLNYYFLRDIYSAVTICIVFLLIICFC